MTDSQPEPVFVEEFTEIHAILEELPEPQREKLAAALDRAERGILKRRKILSYVHEAIDQLRLDMKYLLFDLEATRRERDEYKRALRGESENGGWKEEKP